MCGRYHIDPAAESALLEATGLGPADTLGWREFLEKGAGDICPSQQAPVLTREGGELHLELMTWGWSCDRGAGATETSEIEGEGRWIYGYSDIF